MNSRLLAIAAVAYSMYNEATILKIYIYEKILIKYDSQLLKYFCNKKLYKLTIKNEIYTYM